MADDPIESWCAACDHPTNDIGTPRQPCPKCGATARKAKILMAVSVGLSAGLIVKGFSETKRPKKPGEPRKPFFEERNIDELYRKDGKMYRMQRIIDYVKDWYYKKYTDEKTGDTVYEVSHSLRDEHQPVGWVEVQRNPASLALLGFASLHPSLQNCAGMMTATEFF